MPDDAVPPGPDHAADLAKAISERDDARAECDLLQERIDHLEQRRREESDGHDRVTRLVAERDAAEGECDRLHELLRHLHANAASAVHADLIALHIDVRKPRRGA